MPKGASTDTGALDPKDAGKPLHNSQKKFFLLQLWTMKSTTSTTAAKDSVFYLLVLRNFAFKNILGSQLSFQKWHPFKTKTKRKQTVDVSSQYPRSVGIKTNNNNPEMKYR